MADRVDKISNARRWTMLVCSLIAAMTTTCATAGVAYVIPELHRAQGMSLSSAAVLAAVPTIGLTLTIIAWGAALDRFGERRVLILSLLITLAGTVATLVAAANGAGFAVLAAGLLVGGLGAGAANGERRGTTAGADTGRRRCGGRCGANVRRAARHPGAQQLHRG